MDNRAMEDLLNRKIYAEKIASELIEHYNSEKQAVREGKKEKSENIVFAISGKWGEGKTELLNFMKGPLKAAGFEIVPFNPWRYSQQDITLKRAFLRVVKNELHSDVDLEDLYFDQTKTVINWKLLPWGFIIKWLVIVTVIIILAVPHDLFRNIFHELWSSGIAAAMTTLVLIPVLIKTIVLSKRAGNISTAEEFEEKFDKILRDKEKIVIFIDDLDRCNPKTVKTILDSLRTFFQHPECSYVITGDHTIIERYAAQELEMDARATDQEKAREGRRFLKKLFDVYWRLPLPTPHKFTYFVETELKNSGITLIEIQSANLKSFLVDDDLFERNLRHVKRFITKLRFAIESIKLQLETLNKETNGTLAEQKKSLEEILANPDLLAKVLLLEDLFYPVYEKLIMHPEELVKNEKYLRDRNNASEISISGESVLEILGKSTAGVEKYVALVNRQPRFTDENNSTIHEVANYFYFSGSTGLPLSSGPDESKFAEYIKTGQAVAKLGNVLTVATKDKNKAFAELALSLYAKSLAAKDPDSTTVLPSILSESLKFAAVSDEWADKLGDWKAKMEALPQPNAEAEKFFITAALKKKPDMLDLVDEDDLWNEVESFEEPLNEAAVAKLEKLVKKALPEPIGLRGAQYMISYNDKSPLRDYIKDQLMNFDACKDYITKLQTLKLEDGEIFSMAKEILRSLLEKNRNLDWIVANKTLLTQLQLFDKLRQDIAESTNNSDLLVSVAAHSAALAFTSDETKKIVDNISRAARAAKLSLLADANIRVFLPKDARTDIFSVIADIFMDPKNDLEKRKEGGTLLFKTNALWSDISRDDVYAALKEINKVSLQRNTDLIAVRKEILNSWGYEDVAKAAAKTEGES